MNESPVAREWRAEAARKAKADMLGHILEARGIVLPKDVADCIRACADGEQLDRWVLSAAVATTLDEFLKDAGL
jgi:hypothetical protein